jgi:peptidyl-prolyl cis-trans isomerase D
MPFAVFRRHQRTLMAALAIFAMVAFTLDFSLFRNRFGSAREDAVVVKLAWRTVRQSDLSQIMVERSRANQFMMRLLAAVYGPYAARPDFFGGLNHRALVDALILQHEADRLGIPVRPELAIRSLRELTKNGLNDALFRRIYRGTFSDQITDDQLLAEIADQIRLAAVLELPGRPPVTPLDVWRAYREQNERISARAMPIYVEDFVAKVPEPTETELRAYFDRYRDVLPDPGRDTPGFKVPRRIQVEYVMIDTDTLAREIKAKLTENELRDVYTQRQAEFAGPRPELPDDLFAGDPKATLTPRLGDPFVEVKPMVASTVADERAREEVDRRFGELRDKYLQPFTDKYDQIVGENKDAKDENRATKPLPEPGDVLERGARAIGLAYEKTPLLDQAQAEHYGQISGSKQGTGTASDTRPFSLVFFDPKGALLDPVEMADSGHRYLAWKVQDLPARVPTLDEARTTVIHDWKLDKARALAEKEAQELAKSARQSGGDLKAAAGTRSLITIPPVSKLQPGAPLGAFQFDKPTPSLIPGIPEPSEALRQALFSLAPKSVAVAPNRPKTIYYVLAFDQAYPVNLAGLYSTRFGSAFTYRNEAITDASRRRLDEWMAELRRKAGVPAGWIPPDETKMIASTAGD